MTKISKRVIISVLTLILTVAAIGTTTFAWFSLSTVSKVSNITGEVKATGGGLDVRLVALNDEATPWRANLDVGQFIVDNYNLKFDGVTTTDGAVFKKMSTVDEKLVVNLLTADPGVDYLEFRVQFRSDEEGKVNLTGYNIIGDPSNDDFVPDVDYRQTDAVGLTQLSVENDPSNAIRLYFAAGAFGTVANNYAYQKEALAYDDDNGTLITGNSAANEPVLFGQWSYLTEGKVIELYHNDGISNHLIEPSNNNSKVGYGDVNMTMLDAFESALDSNNVPRTSVTLVKNNNGGPLYISGTGMKNDHYVGEFVVKIWIEGWDADAYNAIYEGLVSIELTFEYESI